MYALPWSAHSTAVPVYGRRRCLLVSLLLVLYSAPGSTSTDTTATTTAGEQLQNSRCKLLLILSPHSIVPTEALVPLVPSPDLSHPNTQLSCSTEVLASSCGPLLSFCGHCSCQWCIGNCLPFFVS